MPSRRVIRQRPTAKANGDPPTEFVELAPGELGGVFAAPTWLRDLGMMSWLLVGIAALLSLTNAIVAPVVTASIVAAVLSPLVGLLHRHGLPRAAAAALVFVAIIAVGIGFTVLIIGGVAGQAAGLESTLTGAAGKLETTLKDAGVSAN